MESSLRSPTPLPSNTRAVKPKLILTIRGFTRLDGLPVSAHSVGSARKSIPRSTLSPDPKPKAVNTLAKRMSRTEGAMPAKRGST